MGEYISPLKIFAYTRTDVSIAINIINHAISYTRAARVSVFVLLWGLITVCRVGRVGGVSLFSIPVLKWEPFKESI